MWQDGPFCGQKGLSGSGCSGEKDWGAACCAIQTRFAGDEAGASQTTKGHNRSGTYPQLSVYLATYTDGPHHWPATLTVARAMDEAGVDRVVVSDHVAFGENFAAYGDPALGGTTGGRQPAAPSRIARCDVPATNVNEAGWFIGAPPR